MNRGTIERKHLPYHLKVTANKRKPIYETIEFFNRDFSDNLIIQNIYKRTIPYHYNEITKK